MASVFGNGGLIGLKTNFSNTNRYITATSPGPAEITFVGSTGRRTLSGSAITLPAGLQQGDFVIVATASDNVSFPSSPAGYTLGQRVSTGPVGSVWSYKIMGAIPDTTAAGLNADTASAHLAIAFRGVDPDSPFSANFPLSPTGIVTSSGNPNSSAITGVPATSMVVSLGFLDDDNVSAQVVPPTGYTFAAASQATNPGATVMAAYLTAPTFGTYDPDSFSSAPIGSDDWAATTIALRRQGDIPTFGNQRNSGIWRASTQSGNTLGASLNLNNTESYVIGSTPNSITSVSFVASAAFNANTITIPATAQAGDIAILSHNGGQAGGPPGLVDPPGWTLITKLNTDVAITAGLYYKVLQPSDIGATLTLSPTYTASNRKIISIFRANIPLTSGAGIFVASLASQANTNNSTADQTINISGRTAPVIAFVNHYMGFPITTRSSSVVMNEILGSSTVHYFKYQIYNSNPQNIVVSQNGNGGSGSTIISGGLVISDSVSIIGNQRNSGIWSQNSNYDAAPKIKSSYQGSQALNNSGTVFTYSLVNVSAPGLAVVSVHSEAGASSSLPLSVSIGGIPATRAIAVNSLAVPSTNSSIWYAEIISPTSSIVVTYNTTQQRNAIGVNVITGHTSAVPIFIGSSSDSNLVNSRAVALNNSTKGMAVIAAATFGDKYQSVWTGVSENYDSLFGLSGDTTGVSGASSVTQASVVSIDTGTETNATQSSSLVVVGWT